MRLFKVKKVYVVNMLRYGSRENHSYALSVHSTVQKAYDAGEREAIDRGGKYEYEIIEMDIDKKHGVEKYLKSMVEPCSQACKTDCNLKRHYGKPSYIKS